jgi:hypothetical protein
LISTTIARDIVKLNTTATPQEFGLLAGGASRVANGSNLIRAPGIVSDSARRCVVAPPARLKVSDGGWRNQRIVITGAERSMWSEYEFGGLQIQNTGGDEPQFRVRYKI